MKKVLALLIALLALNAIPAVYADEPTNDVSASEPLPDGVEPLPELVPAQ
jgi:hypothetical protein